MRFITPNYKILQETDPFLQIEGAGRTCYQSEPKEGDTPQAFFGRLKGRKHFAMIEFAHMVFHISDGDNVSWRQCKEYKYLDTTEVDGRRIVSGNMRAINESGISILLKAILAFDKNLAPLCYTADDELLNADWSQLAVCKVIPEDQLDQYLLTVEEKIAHEYLAVRLQTCRGVTHEIVRNRPFSFAQESTRYVKYGKVDENGDKEPMLFMLPPWIDHDDAVKLLANDWVLDPEDPEQYHKIREEYDFKTSTMVFLYGLMHDEYTYARLMDLGWAAQQSRESLPNALKTEIVIKGPISQWLHFLFLRCDKPAHPQMREWTIPLFNELRTDRPEIWDRLLEKIDITGV